MRTIWGHLVRGMWHSAHPRVHQADHTETGPTFLPGQEGKTLYSWLEGNPIEAIKNQKKPKLLLRFLQHSRVLPRNMIQLTINLERRAGQWPKGCSIHQIFRSLRMLMHSWPRTSLWFQNRKGNWKVITSKRAFSKTLRKFLAKKPVSRFRTRCLH